MEDAVKLSSPIELRSLSESESENTALIASNVSGFVGVHLGEKVVLVVSEVAAVGCFVLIDSRKVCIFFTGLIMPCF